MIAPAAVSCKRMLARPRMLGWPMLDNGHCRRDHDAHAADPCDEVGWGHSVLDQQITEAASQSNEPAAPAAVVKIGCWLDQGPAGNSPPFVRRSTVLDNRHGRGRPHVRTTIMRD